MAPTAKEQYDRLHAKLVKQHSGVADGVTSRVSDQQLEELDRLQAAYHAELGGGRARLGESSNSLGRLREIEKREEAVKKREEAVRGREIECEQNEMLLESLKGECEMWREKDSVARSGKGA